MPMVLGRALTRKVQARAELAHVSAKTFGRECDRIKRPLTESICFSGCVALFMGKRAVEKAAARKSPTAGLPHSAWKSRNCSAISHLFHRPDHEEFRFPILSGKKNS